MGSRSIRAALALVFAAGLRTLAALSILTWTPAALADEPRKPAPIKPAPAADDDRPVNPHVTPRSDDRRPVNPHAPKAEASAPDAESAKPTPSAVADAGMVDADKALILLAEGNEHWTSGAPANPNIEAARRRAVAEQGQKPFVTILTCADSRLPVERIFDRGVGDLFVVRVAGNVAGPSEVSTIEYGVEHLKTPLLVIMGHTKCGAVAAAASGAAVHGNLARLLASIAPAVDRARRNNPGVDEKQVAALAVKENVWQTVFDLYKASPTVLEMVRHDELRVVGAICDISTGKVEWLGPHPWQAELLDALRDKKEVPEAVGAADPQH
ncbi:MAG: carbonic anhydrase [Phycisphaerae bacterium]